MRGTLILLLALSGCGYVDVRHARDPYEPLIGMSAFNLIGCAGAPDTVLQTKPDEAVLQWVYKDTQPGFQASAPLIGSVQVGAATQCKFVARIDRQGTVQDVAFPASAGSLTSPPYQGCEQIVGECLSHPPVDTGFPAGYDAFSYLLPARKP